MWTLFSKCSADYRVNENRSWFFKIWIIFPTPLAGNAFIFPRLAQLCLEFVVIESTSKLMDFPADSMSGIEIFP
jgi:hypothetical protein